MAHVAAVKYALVSASNPTVYMWCVLNIFIYIYIYKYIKDFLL